MPHGAGTRIGDGAAALGHAAVGRSAPATLPATAGGLAVATRSSSTKNLVAARANNGEAHVGEDAHKSYDQDADDDVERAGEEGANFGE